jgi:hypothetical protein
MLEVDPAFTTISAWIARGGQSKSKLLIEGLRKAGLRAWPRSLLRDCSKLGGSSGLYAEVFEVARPNFPEPEVGPRWDPKCTGHLDV